MTDIQAPPLNRPTAAQLAVWEEWTDRELLVAQVIRVNGIAGLIVQMANDLPAFMRSPMAKFAMKMMIKPDKSNE